MQPQIRRIPRSVVIIFLGLFVLAGISIYQNTLGKQDSKKTVAIPPVPSIDKVPSGQQGDLIKLGYKYMNQTDTSLPGYVGNNLTCSSCHAIAGTGKALNLVGIPRMFPQYSKRDGVTISLADRINGCFTRSMAGKPLPVDSQDMKAFLAYFDYISTNVPQGIKSRPWAPKVTLPGAIPTLDLANGEKIFKQSCAACHGITGEGNGAGPLGGPQVWGNGSYNIAAGMARLKTTAGFIQKNMPLIPMGNLSPGGLSTQDAYDVAAYINSHQRPDFPGKEHDYPKGGAPIDVPYPLLSNQKQPAVPVNSNSK